MTSGSRAFASGDANDRAGAGMTSPKDTPHDGRRAEALFALQRTCGNAAVSELIRRSHQAEPVVQRVQPSPDEEKFLERDVNRMRAEQARKAIVAMSEEQAQIWRSRLKDVAGTPALPIAYDQLVAHWNAGKLAEYIASLQPSKRPSPGARQPPSSPQPPVIPPRPRKPPERETEAKPPTSVPPKRPPPPLPPPVDWATFPAQDQAFLDALWRRRGELTSAEAVADAYKDSAVKQNTASERDKQQYLTALRQARPELHKQTMASPPKPGSYLDTPSASGVAWRVYVNAVSVHAPTVFAFVQDDVGRVNGVLASKLGDYEMAASSRDTIVIYTSSREAADNAVGRLAAYHQRNQAHFVNELVGLTERTRVPGVSLGEDPPLPIKWSALASAWLEKKGGTPWLEANQRYTNKAVSQQVFGFSFSSLRANLVYAALRDAKGGTEGEQYDDFKRHVLRYFKSAGISPATPERQGELKPEVMEPLIDLFYPKESEESKESKEEET